jgi:hypothetical protein
MAVQLLGQAHRALGAGSTGGRVVEQNEKAAVGHDDLLRCQKTLFVRCAMNGLTWRKASCAMPSSPPVIDVAQTRRGDVAFNQGMELIANAIAGITPRAWIAIAALAVIAVAVLIAIGIAWLLAYAD